VSSWFSFLHIKKYEGGRRPQDNQEGLSFLHIRKGQKVVGQQEDQSRFVALFA
jgi:hypothetical protein